MIFTVPKYGGGGAGATGPSGAPGEARYFLRYTHGVGVPAGGTQYLSLGEGIFSSELGDLLIGDGRIRGVSISVDAFDLSRTYDVQVLSDPAGVGGTGPTVEAVLALPTSTIRNRVSSLVVPVAGLLDLGVRLIRTSGAGASSFSSISVIVEVSIP